jgi:hypothetical protein
MELRKTDEEIMKGKGKKKRGKKSGKREEKRRVQRPKGGGKNWRVEANNLRKKPTLRKSYR